MKARRVLESPYMTADEAAQYLRYGSVRALYKAVVALRIPVCRRGDKTFLFDKRELDQWVRGERRAKTVAARLRLVHTASVPEGAGSEQSRNLDTAEVTR